MSESLPCTYRFTGSDFLWPAASLVAHCAGVVAGSLIGSHCCAVADRAFSVWPAVWPSAHCHLQVTLPAYCIPTCTHDNPLAGPQFCPMRQPPTPSKSTQRMGRQSSVLTHFLRLMVHSPALHVSCAQSAST